MNFFDHLNSINTKNTRSLLPESDDCGESRKAYVPFMINRGLSYFSDTVLLANEMNQRAGIDVAMQYDFLYNLVRKGRRFSKWHKADKIADIEIVMAAFSYSYDKARAAIKLLSKEQLSELKKRMDKGGKQ